MCGVIKGMGRDVEVGHTLAMTFKREREDIRPEQAVVRRGHLLPLCRYMSLCFEFDVRATAAWCPMGRHSALYPVLSCLGLSL